MRTSTTALVLMAITSSCAMGCTASLELDRFRRDEARVVDATNITYFDLRFSAKNMQSHIGEYFELRLVDKGNAVQGKAVYVDVVRPDFSISLPKLIGKVNAPYRIDFWADHNQTNRYDGVEGSINEKDHAWRRVLADPLPEDVRLVNGRYEFSFLHDTAFVDVFTDLAGNKISGADTLLPLKITIAGAGAYIDKMVELRVTDKGSGRLVALHRIGRAKETYVAEVTGVIDEETPYQIAAYVDVDGNDEYSPSDPSWQLELLSGENGVTGELNLTTASQRPLGEIQ
jgi:hypothetical protein